MLDKALADFAITPDDDLALMRAGQTLGSLSGALFSALDQYFEKHQPDIVVVQGDTTTALVGGVAAFYRGIKVAHVEAGLRTNTIHEPFPEEFNRRVLSLVADYHFAPTTLARDHLLREGVSANNITTCGNTGIDALLLTVQKVRNNESLLAHPIQLFLESFPQYVLVTVHRRENHGDGINSICAALKQLAEQYPQLGFILPVHMNPNVKDVVESNLSGLGNVLLTGPLDYQPFVKLMSSCHFLLTDSGGVQEEAPSLGKPILVLRHVTERPEGIAAGCAKLLGNNTENIVSEVNHLLSDMGAYKAMAQAKNPYGDGTASQQILQVLANGDRAAS